MRGALHILAVAVLLPYLALAFGFLVLRHSISSGTLLSFFETLIAHAGRFAQWGIYVAAFAILVLALLGLIPRFRWLGALCLTVLAASSLLVIAFAPTTGFEFGHWLFLLPCALVLLFGVWLYRAERRVRRVSRLTA